MTVKKVRIELARNRDFPNGSREYGYEFTAPLDDEGHIIADEWRKERDRFRVRRFARGEPDEVGHLVRKPGGSWAFHYDINGDVDDNDTGYRFGNHIFRRGEYISIRDHDDDELHTYRVITVEPV